MYNIKRYEYKCQICQRKYTAKNKNSKHCTNPSCIREYNRIVAHRIYLRHKKPNVCKVCGKDRGKYYKYCPDCEPQTRGMKTHVVQCKICNKQIITLKNHRLFCDDCRKKRNQEYQKKYHVEYNKIYIVRYCKCGKKLSRYQRKCESCK